LSHFEYISVAIALVFALAVGRLLAGLSPSLESGRRYSLHAAWVVGLLLAAVMQWWVIWRISHVAWTPIRFLWALAIPGIIFVRAGVLLSAHPDEVASFRDHFFAHRIQFFALGVIGGIHAAMSPWVLGIVPWLEFAPVHPNTISLTVLSTLGLIFKDARVHALIVLVSLLGVLSAFYVLPAVEPAA